MKKESTPDSVIQELIALVPARKIKAVKSFSRANKSQKNQNATDPADLELNTEGTKMVKNYFRNANEPPRFCYVAHMKKDGILAARSLHNAVKVLPNYSDTVYNPEINEKELSAHIPPHRLIAEAVEAGLVKRKGIPLWQTFASVLVGFGAVASAVDAVMGIMEKLGPGNTLQTIFGSTSIWVCIAVVAVFVACICSVGIQSRKNKQDLLIELNNVLADMGDEDFLEFLNQFSPGEISIPDCARANPASPVYICAMQSYNYRQQQILHAVWSGADKKQLWFIFLEETERNASLVLPTSNARERRLFRMNPLAKDERKRIAAKAYAGQTKFHPNEDAGIKNHGVDYVCRFLLREKGPVADAQQLDGRIKEFCKEYSPSYQADIKLVIRLIAELNCNYHIDFTSRRNWEYLFSYQSGDTELIALDQEITARLQLDNRTVKNLIPEIQHQLGDFFEEIVVAYQSTEQTSEYKQWCLIKALRCRPDSLSDRYMSIADALMNEWQYPEDIDSAQWIGILIRTLHVFYRHQVFWFLPSVVHNLLRICDRRTNALPRRVFSDPVVLEVSRANLLLNINTSEDVGGICSIDLIRDHSQVVTRAAAEMDPQWNPDKSRSIPSYLDMLQLSAAERLQYYNALTALREQLVLDYYSYQYDIYCASLTLINDNIEFCCLELYNNSLYNKYGKKAHLASPDADTYIRIIVGQLLDQLGNTYGVLFPTIGKAVEELRDLLDGRVDEDAAQQLLFLLAKFDIIGAVTLNYLACLIARLAATQGIPNDVYLSLGNYLIAMVFLTYHENTQASFYNHDFIHLVRLSTSYTEPNGAVLGYMCYCDTMFKSTTTGEMIKHYIHRHKKQYLDNLDKVIQQLKGSDLEGFFTFLDCISLPFEEKTCLYESLRTAVSTKYSENPKAPVILEYLSLRLDHCSTEAFRKDTPENNLEKLQHLSNNMAFLVYNLYLLHDQERYLELCPILAEKILNATLTNRVVPLLFYAEHCKNKSSEDHIKCIRLIYTHLLNEELRYKVIVLEDCVRFLLTCLDRRNKGDSAYLWLDPDEATKLLLRVESEREQQMVTRAREHLAQRTWNKYGMILFLRHMMTQGRMALVPVSAEYDTLTEEGKAEHLSTHYMTIRPLVETDDSIRFNSIYVDMLTAFINDPDMQERVDEKACLRKMVEDAYAVVDRMFVPGSKHKEEVQALIRDYADMLDRD